MIKNKFFIILTSAILFTAEASIYSNSIANSLSHASLGNRQAKNGDYAQSLNSLNASIQSNPQNARAYKLRGHVYYAKGNYSKALADLNTVVTLVPDSANALADRAIVYSVMGKHGLALSDIERALELKPSSSFAQAVRKEILERAK